jgi:hypothetical protein
MSEASVSLPLAEASMMHIKEEFATNMQAGLQQQNSSRYHTYCCMLTLYMMYPACRFSLYSKYKQHMSTPQELRNAATHSSSLIKQEISRARQGLPLATHGKMAEQYNCLTTGKGSLLNN